MRLHRLPILYQDTEVRTFPINRKVFTIISFSKPNNLKLRRIIFMQESNGYTYGSFIIHRNILSLIDIYTIEIVKFRI